jgi:2-phospho-L-lactate guanylyltransferase (CobY/MobA/RfbA family)
MRISNSFSEGEIQIMEFILATMLRGGTPNMAARHKDFASLYRKVISMKTRLEKTKTKTSSSVGTIAAVEDDIDDELDTAKAV